MWNADGRLGWLWAVGIVDVALTIGFLVSFSTGGKGSHQVSILSPTGLMMLAFTLLHLAVLVTFLVVVATDERLGSSKPRWVVAVVLFNSFAGLMYLGRRHRS